MKHRCIVKSMALKFLMGLIVCVWLDSDVRAQGGGEIQNPPCCILSIPKRLAGDVGRSIPPISVDNSVANPPRFITCPNTNPPVAAWCTKSKEPLPSNKTACDIYGGSPTFGIVGDVRYDCFATTTLDFCDGKFAGVELKKTDGTWGFCAPKAGSEGDVSPRAESPILGYAEGDFYRFSCQPNAAENSECDYVKDPAKTRYPYLAVKEGEPDAKKGECVTRPRLVCKAGMVHRRRWKDPTCRAGARTPPAWNSADLGQYPGAVEIGTKEKHGELFYSHTEMPAGVKVCMPKSAGGTGGGGGGGGNGGGNTIACTLGPCGGKTNGVPNGCPGVSVSTPTGCGCSSDGKPPCNGGGTGGSNGGGSSGGGGTTGGAGSGGSGSGGGNGGNGSDGSGGRVCTTITCPRGQQQNPLTCECEPSNNGGSNGGGPSAGGGANGNNGTGGGAPAGGGITVVIIPPPDNPLERLSGGARGFSGGGAPPAASGGVPAANFDRSRR